MNTKHTDTVSHDRETFSARARRTLPIHVDISSHRLNDLLAAKVTALSPRDARRAFGGVLMRVLSDELDDPLFERVLARHPRHDRAMDRLLDDLQIDAPADFTDDERERAEFDMTCDNDFDGMG